MTCKRSGRDANAEDKQLTADDLRRVKLEISADDFANDLQGVKP